MTISSAITAAQERVANCFTSVETMGGTLPEVKNLTNLPAAIESIPQGGGGSGGDLIFAENRLGRTPIQDEKVLLTTNTNSAISYTGNLGQDTVYSRLRIYDDICYNVNSANGYSTAYTYQNGAWTNYRTHDMVAWDSRFSFIFNDGVWYQIHINSSNFDKYDEKVGAYIANNLPFLQINDSLKIKGSDGKIYSNDETQSYDTGMGNIGNTKKLFQLVNNILICFLANGTLKFIDITNFPNCSETIYNLPHNDTYFLGVSGTNINDFAITLNSNTLVINKLTSNGYEEYKVIDILSNYSIYFDINVNRIVGIQANYYPFILQLSNNSVATLEIPAEVRETFKQDITSSGYNITTTRFFDANAYLTYFGWSWSTGSYDNFSRFCAMGADGIWYITEPTVENYQNVGSFTGFVTGNKDENNRYEIKTVLPDKVDVTLNITPDPDSITVYGGIE